jgi:hypothetical protein
MLARARRMPLGTGAPREDGPTRSG